jgi:hypothetical protein
MNWDAIGAVGELLGSILVLLTLVYLAIQTRSINKQSKAEARYTFVASMGEINLNIAQNPQTASVWRRGLDSVETLSEDERMQFIMYMGQYTNFWSVMHQLKLDGTLPATQWLVVKNDILSILGSDGGKFFWEHGGRAAFDKDFALFIDTTLEASNQLYDMARMTRKSIDAI